MKVQYQYFIYTWNIDQKETEYTRIRAYGIDKKNRNVCVVIDDFTPYIYLELPENINWSELAIQRLSGAIESRMKENAPIKTCLVFKHKLYVIKLNKNGERKKFPFLFCSFNHYRSICILNKILRQPIKIPVIGVIRLKIHESDADPILQLVCNANINSVGMVRFVGTTVEKENQTTYCDLEFKASWKSLKCIDTDEICKPLIMGFDIEVNSTDPSRVPTPTNCKPGDVIFQIACIFNRFSSPDKKAVLLTLGNATNDFTNECETEVRCFKTEYQLLEGFTSLIREYQPNILCGYNILGFDMKYMIHRAKFSYCISKFDMLGFHRYHHCEEKVIKWSSSAFKAQEFHTLDMEGRILIDLMPLIQRDYKLNDYTLKTVSKEILKNDNKIDLAIVRMFKLFKIGMTTPKNDNDIHKSTKAMNIIGEYCFKDADLCMKLMDKLQAWVGLVEFAKTVNTGIFTLFTQGQQIKVFSQVYKYCLQNNMVVQKDGYVCDENEMYAGAHVFPPEPGLYERVIPFDFCSLYPSLIIAYNLDYSTIVDDDDNLITDKNCHVIDFDEHNSCEHDPKIIKIKELDVEIKNITEDLKKLRKDRDKVGSKRSSYCFIENINAQILELQQKIKPIRLRRVELKKGIKKRPLCGRRHYRFYKHIKGVIPTILQNLLDSRAAVRKQMKAISAEIKTLDDDNKKLELTILNTVLEKRQLAYKISANSMYGSFGVKKGYLPFMPGAICTTHKGRLNLEKAANALKEKHGAKLIYGDSVVEDTPILCKIDGKIMYRTIDNLPHYGWNVYRDEKEDAIPRNIEVWTENGFTKIKKIIRHKTNKDIYRILTHTGVVDITEDHGLLDMNANKISPKELTLESELLTAPLPDININHQYDKISPDLAFVMGLFYADGSCGEYNCDSGRKYSWALNNADRTLLTKCEKILNENKHDYYLFGLSFKILETVKSSKVFKLVPCGKGIKDFVRIWRQLFYEQNKYKKLPDEILWSNTSVRHFFLDGYYAGGGDTDKHGYYRFDNKGKIGSAGLYLLAFSLGYKVSINVRKDKMNIYRMTCTKNHQRKNENVVKKIILLEKTNRYVYDLETENHHFSAGIGKLIVHNTDSCYCSFPSKITAKETWDYAEIVATEVSALFPPPMKLEFEKKIYWQFLILTMKRYMYLSCTDDGIIEPNIGKRGILLSRRDNSLFIRNFYSNVIKMIFDGRTFSDIVFYLMTEINRLMSHSISSEEFIITKSVGDTAVFYDNDINYIEQFEDEKGRTKGRIGTYLVDLLPEDANKREKQLSLKNASNDKEYYERCLPAQVQLSFKIKRRGGRVDVGTRLKYVIIEEPTATKQYERIESYDYFLLHSDVLKIDVFYYLKTTIKPFEQLLSVYDKKFINFFDTQYKFRFKYRQEMLGQLKSYFRNINITDNKRKPI